MSPNDLTDLAVQFWLDKGENPTHVLLSEEQYNTFNSCFIPRERNGSEGRVLGLSSYTLANGVEIILVKCQPMQPGNDYIFPRMIRSLG